MRITWQNVRREAPTALIAERIQNHECRADARLWHRPTEQKPWVVDVRVDCPGAPVWVRSKAYLQLPAAIHGYLVRRDQAELRLAAYERNF